MGFPDAVANLAVSSVATAPSPATTGVSLVVAAGEGSRFPAVPFNATVCPANTLPTPANAEIVRVTTIAGDTLTITRAQEGTTARSILVGDLIAATITKKSLTDRESGFEVDYVEYTAPVTVSATTEAAATTVVTGSAIDYDGATAVWLEFFAPTILLSATPAAPSVATVLYEDGASIGRWGNTIVGPGNQGEQLLKRKITPASGSHTFSVRAFRDSGAGANQVFAGVGGSGNFLPGYLRTTKA